MMRLLARLTLLLALVAGQCAYAEHNVDLIGDDHDHISDCVFCLSESNDCALIEFTDSVFTVYISSSVLSLLSEFSTAFHRRYSIRAPPVNS